MILGAIIIALIVVEIYYYNRLQNRVVQLAAQIENLNQRMEHHAIVVRLLQDGRTISQLDIGGNHDTDRQR